jgi:hypothetical protein
MKRRRESPAVILFILAAAVAVHAEAQWTGSGDTLPIFRAGSVGIGASPNTLFDVSGGVATIGGTGSSFGSANRIQLELYNTDSETSIIRSFNRGSGVYKDIGFGEIDRLILKGTTGNIGIGTRTPNARLSLGGLAGIKLLTYDDPALGTDYKMGFGVNLAGISSSIDVVMGRGDGTDNSFNVVKPNGGWQYPAYSAYTALLTVLENGNVGVGTPVPVGPSSKLEVYGANPVLKITQNPGVAGSALLMLAPAGGGCPSDGTACNTAGIALRGGSPYIYNESSNANLINFGADLYPSHAKIVFDINSGSIRATGVIGSVFQDVAEWVPASGDVPPGTVVVLNSEKNNEVIPSTSSYDTRVAGVVSARPGLLLGEESASKAKIATTGRVKVRVDATKHAIHVGDLLVTSDRPGTAMLSMPLDLGGVKIHRPGTLIGKALEPMAKGQGEILVLLSLQ